MGFHQPDNDHIGDFGTSYFTVCGWSYDLLKSWLSKILWCLSGLGI